MVTDFQEIIKKISMCKSLDEAHKLQKFLSQKIEVKEDQLLIIKRITGMTLGNMIDLNVHLISERAKASQLEEQLRNIRRERVQLKQGEKRDELIKLEGVKLGEMNTIENNINFITDAIKKFENY
jgi:hypothetical protein